MSDGSPDKMHQYTITTRVWIYPGKISWHFVSIPKNITKQINKKYTHLKRGFGSLKVEVTIGDTTWLTSMFPDKKEGIYLLPIKKSVRQREDVLADKKTTFTIRLIQDQDFRI